MAQLNLGLIVLWHVKVHFISIEIRIIRFRTTYVHTKRIALVHNPRNMTHHTHPMKCRLTIEEDSVAVHHVTMNDIAIIQHNIRAVRITKRNRFARLPLQDLRAGILIRSRANQPKQELLVPVIYNNRLRNILRISS